MNDHTSVIIRTLGIGIRALSAIIRTLTIGIRTLHGTFQAEQKHRGLHG